MLVSFVFSFRTGREMAEKETESSRTLSGTTREKEKEVEGGEGRGGESEKERTCCVYFQSC